MNIRLLLLLGILLTNLGVRAAAAPALLPALPPLPPLPPSPVATFRALLAMTPQERETTLTNRPEKQRHMLQARLVEYQAMPHAIREDRLRATDLYWHLQQLLRRAPAERADLLVTVPEDLRVILSARLELWNQLPESDQETLLQHDRAIRYFARLRSIPPPPLPGGTVVPTPSMSQPIQEELEKLAALSPVERERIRRQWSQFFEVPRTDSLRAIQSMSARERREMVEVLDRFRQLSPVQRQACIESFTRFASMPPIERAAFLRHAEHWGALTPEERASWRRLVTKLPPLPPLPTPPAGAARAPTRSARAEMHAVSISGM